MHIQKFYNPCFNIVYCTLKLLCDQDQYLSMIEGYCAAHGVAVDPEVLRAEAIEWQATRGSRSGRVAWQFFVDLAGRHGVVV